MMPDPPVPADPVPGDPWAQLTAHSNIDITDRVERLVEPERLYYVALDVDAARQQVAQQTTRLLDEERRRWYAAIHKAHLLSDAEGLSPEVAIEQVAQQHAQEIATLQREIALWRRISADDDHDIEQLEAALAQRTQELQLNASMLARQCDLARDAENERDRLQAAHTALQEQLREMIQHWQTTAQLNEFLVSRVGGEPVFPYRWFAKELEALLPPPTPPGEPTDGGRASLQGRAQGDRR